MDERKLGRSRGAREGAFIFALSAAGAFVLAVFLAGMGRPQGAAVLEPGEQLGDVPLLRVTAAGAAAASIADLFVEECGLAIFFVSTCPFCREMAPAWRDVDSVDTRSGNLPVYWIAASAGDTGAERFVEFHSLSRPWYAIPTKADRWALGIDSWPKIYLIAAGGDFIAEVQHREPALVQNSVHEC